MFALSRQWEENGDRRAIFLECYAIMTHNMKQGLREGRFKDADWVNGLLEHFAGYYFSAVENFDAGCLNKPEVWCHAFTETGSGRHHVLQYLLLGVNAHINYDLVLALYDRSCNDWPLLNETQRENRRHDHKMVNNIIAETIDKVQDEVIEKYAPAMDIVDKLMGRVDEWLLAELIASWRASVWQDACAMLDCPSEESRTLLRMQVEEKALGKARRLLQM